jgi:hypothetical protein
LKRLSIIMALIVLLLACIGISFQAGKNAGFKSGSEWALVQAKIVAEEAGVFMPVHMNDGKFIVVLRQPPGVYRRAWEMADEYEEAHEPVITAKTQDEGGEHKAEGNI